MINYFLMQITSRILLNACFSHTLRYLCTCAPVYHLFSLKKSRHKILKPVYYTDVPTRLLENSCMCLYACCTALHPRRSYRAARRSRLWHNISGRHVICIGSLLCATFCSSTLYRSSSADSGRITCTTPAILIVAEWAIPILCDVVALMAARVRVS